MEKHMHDLVIRGGTVIDGLGGPGRIADVAIDGDRIVHVGPDAGKGAEEIDATGKLVTPGFVDLHTHFDAQATWDPVLAPSAWHGITTLVIGNCGVGFAPVRPEARDWLIDVMENVEEIPAHVLKAGLKWDWESFPDYLDALDARDHSVDIVAQVPHIALRAYVMGERAMRDEPATAEDIAMMGDLLEQAMAAGAIGFACSRTDLHRFADGRLIPGSMGREVELLALAGRVGSGQIEYLGMLSKWDENLPFMAEMSRRSGGAVHFAMIEKDSDIRIAGMEEAAKTGAKLVGHVPPRAVGNYLHWRGSRHPFMSRPSFRAIAGLPWAEQYARLSDPAFRTRMLAEENEGVEKLSEVARWVLDSFERMYPIADRPDYEPDPATDSIAALAAKTGQDPLAYAYDVMMRNEGGGMIYLALANYGTGSFTPLRALLARGDLIAGLSDAGAHCLRVVDASAPTFMLTHWGRDRARGATLPVELIVKSCTSDPARAYGLEDRGVVAAGYLADLNVIDFERLSLPVPHIAADLPAGGERLVQRAEGYVATIKSGRPTFRDGMHSGAYPGKVVRGPQKARAA
jgi:N-acyl-D-aspartate/D-glutamate deacylase